MSEFIVASQDELELLTKRQRQVYERVRFAREVIKGENERGMTFEEIADELGLSEMTVNSHWNTAMRKLREYRTTIESPVNVYTDELLLKENKSNKSQ